MGWHYTPYVWYLILSTVVSAALGGYAWRRRDVPAATSLSLLSIVASVWCLSNALEMAARQLPMKTFWANAQYMCYGTAPLACLNLAIQHTGMGRWLNGRRIATLLVIPAVTFILTWTNDLHGLIRRDVRMDTTGPFPVISKTYGPWFWVFAAYSYLLVMMALLLFANHMLRTAPPYRGQSLTLMGGLLLPMVSSALYTLGLSPVPTHDISPAAFTVSGAVITWGLFRYRLFDIVPVAYANVIANMGDGIILLNVRGRIVELNPAAQRIFGVGTLEAAGRRCDEALPGWPISWDYSGSAELESDSGRHYEMYSSTITDDRSTLCGRLVVIHDATENRNTQAILVKHQRELAVAGERERLARELHDSLGQVLGYVNVETQAIRELVAAGNTSLAAEQLERLADVAQEAHTSLREYIRSMRETSPGLDFLSALRRRALYFERITGIHTELVVPDNVENGMFEPGVEIQILGILQEALANVRKHARATSVRILLSPGESTADIIVSDDGCGFEPGESHAINGHGFGLDIMRERAEESGGSLVIRSAPGKGTTVIASVPLSSRGTGSEDTPRG